MSKEAIKNLKSGNYEIVDSQGVSVTTHFIECLEKEFADLEAKLAEKYQAIESLQEINQSLGHTCNNDAKEIDRLREQLAEKETEHELLIDQFEEETENLRKQIKQESDARKRFVEANKQLKQSQNQTAIAVLEEILDNEVYINSKLDFEDGNYVLSKIIRTKIEELKNGRN